MTFSPTDVKYEDILKGYAFFPFELSPSRNVCDLQAPKVRNVRLELKFKENLTESLELLCFLETCHVFHVDKGRKVTYANY